MIPRYCLPCPRASMSVRNSFLSWISFITGQGRRAVSVQGSGCYQAPGRGSGAGGLPFSGTRSSSVVRECFSLRDHPPTHSNSGPPPHTLPSPAWLADQWFTFFKPVRFRGWVFLTHRRRLSFPFIWVLPSGKDILESSFFFLHVSCRAQK